MVPPCPLDPPIPLHKGGLRFPAKALPSPSSTFALMLAVGVHGAPSSWRAQCQVR